MRISRWLIFWPLTSVLGFGACIATAPDGLRRETDDPDAGDGGSLNVDAKPPDDPPDSTTSDPHAVVGAEPSHGAFNGGQRVLIHGNGFSSEARVWFGNTEVPSSAVVAIDPGRVQVAAPEGKAGPVDVTVQNGDDTSTRRTLLAGYSYDALFAAPSSGPVQGGTVVQIVGQGTAWDGSTVAKIDQKACASLTVVGPTLLECAVPAGTPGAKTVSVKTGAETISVLDGFTYEDSTNGFEGGLSGSPLAGKLKALVYDNYTGDAIPGAHVVVGAPIASAILRDTDASGVAVIDDASLDGPRTVTITARCHSPQTFVDVPVDTMTIYLDPILTPECAGSGDPPPVGGHYAPVGTITGELVWEGGVEFQKAPWSNVPAPNGGNERQAAYVFAASSDPSAKFARPSTVYAVTTESEGGFGYGFSSASSTGSKSLYALAGIEDLVKGTFTAYVMGTARGIPVLPDQVSPNVYIAMNTTLDQALTMDVTAPPPGFKGPDRLRATVSVMLGNDGYIILPAGSKEPLLPLQGLLSFVGVPPLHESLLGSSYVTTARAVTGPNAGAPMSVVAQVRTTTASQPVVVGDFVPVPALETPAAGAGWDGKHLSVSFASGGTPIDISVYDIVAANGLAHWLVAVPKGSNTVELPDLSGFELASLPKGPLTIGITAGRVDDFDYAKLVYANLRSSGMRAYSLDYFSAHH